MSKKIEIDMSEKLANIVKNYSGLNNLVQAAPDSSDNERSCRYLYNAF